MIVVGGGVGIYFAVSSGSDVATDEETTTIAGGDDTTGTVSTVDGDYTIRLYDTFTTDSTQNILTHTPEIGTTWVNNGYARQPWVWDTGYAKNVTDAFAGCQSITDIDPVSEIVYTSTFVVSGTATTGHTVWILSAGGVGFGFDFERDTATQSVLTVVVRYFDGVNPTGQLLSTTEFDATPGTFDCIFTITNLNVNVSINGVAVDTVTTLTEQFADLVRFTIDNQSIVVNDMQMKTK